jgi:N-acetylglucosaminyldiphosphoundecaprenol N-acetyl-beta-D-mannosaminyltransferase
VAGGVAEEAYGPIEARRVVASLHPDKDGSADSPEGFTHRYIVGMRVDATSYAEAADRIVRWAERGESRYVCVASVNNVVLAHDDDAFASAMNGAHLVTPDGVPLVWGLRLLGVASAARVCGPLLTPLLCQVAAREGIPIGFYGGSPDVLRDLLGTVSTRFPGLEVAYSCSPPFRALTAEEDRRVRAEIRASGARILFVGLGTPKQERWMADRLGAMDGVMVGVGAVFDLLAGRTTRAPGWMHQLGLEWVFRLICEPRRLWKRYLYGNPRFVALFGAQVLRAKWARRERAEARSAPEGGRS